jgi:hypothetical protein
MKTVSAGLLIHLQGGSLTLATLWRVTRLDGAIFTFTDHPADIVYGGETYLAALGYERSAISSGADLAVVLALASSAGGVFERDSGGEGAISGSTERGLIRECYGECCIARNAAGSLVGDCSSERSISSNTARRLRREAYDNGRIGRSSDRTFVRYGDGERRVSSSTRGFFRRETASEGGISRSTSRLFGRKAGCE